MGVLPYEHYSFSMRLPFQVHTSARSGSSVLMSSSAATTIARQVRVECIFTVVNAPPNAKSAPVAGIQGEADEIFDGAASPDPGGKDAPAPSPPDRAPSPSLPGDRQLRREDRDLCPHSREKGPNDDVARGRRNAKVREDGVQSCRSKEGSQRCFHCRVSEGGESGEATNARTVPRRVNGIMKHEQRKI